MTSAVSIFCILAFFCFSPGNTGTIDMNLFLFCKGGYTNWCANIFVYEEDIISPHDFLVERQVCAPPNQRVNVTAALGKIDPDGDTSPTYEIMPLVSHNCSATGEYYCGKRSDAINVVAWQDTVLNLTITMNAQGDTKGKCVHPNTG